MSVTLNGHVYDASQFYGYGYLQNNADTGLVQFPNSIFTDMLAELAAASAILSGGISPSTAGNIIVSNGSLWVRSRDGNYPVVLNGNLTWLTDATYDVGGSGSGRPRDLTISRNLVAGGAVRVGPGTGSLLTGDLQVRRGAADGVIYFGDVAGANDHYVHWTGSTWQLGDAPDSLKIGGLTINNADPTITFGSAGGTPWGSLAYTSASVGVLYNSAGNPMLRLNSGTATFSTGSTTAPVIGAAGTYGMFTLNNTLNTSTGMGLFGRVNGTEGVYYNTPSGTLHRFTVNGAGIFFLSGSDAQMSGNFIALTDATYDIGGAGANRFRDLNLSRNAVIGGTVTASGLSVASLANRLGAASGIAGTKASQSFYFYDTSANNWAGMQCDVNGSVVISTGVASRFSFVFGWDGSMSMGTGSFTINSDIQHNAQLRVSNNSNGNYAATFTNPNGTSPIGVDIAYTGIAPNNTGNRYITCDDTIGVKFGVRSNGGIENFSANNVNLSDERTKRMGGLLDGAALSDAFRRIEFSQFQYNDQTHEDWNLGFSAQALYRAFKGTGYEDSIVDQHGWQTKDEWFWAVYETDLMHAGMAVLQHQIRRVDSHESRLDKIEAHLQLAA